MHDSWKACEEDRTPPTLPQCRLFSFSYGCSSSDHLRPKPPPASTCIIYFFIYYFSILESLTNLSSSLLHFLRWPGGGSPRSALLQTVSTIRCSSFRRRMNTHSDGWRLSMAEFHLRWKPEIESYMYKNYMQRTWPIDMSFLCCSVTLKHIEHILNENLLIIIILIPFTQLLVRLSETRPWTFHTAGGNVEFSPA